jgi:hypothetical protein
VGGGPKPPGAAGAGAGTAGADVVAGAGDAEMIGRLRFGGGAFGGTGFLSSTNSGFGSSSVAVASLALPSGATGLTVRVSGP